ncbi:MAG: sensor histidine kinase [Vicinamibacterales bacterium]
MLYEFIETNHDEIVKRCRARVALRTTPPPTAAEIDHGVPVFLGQLTEALRFGLTSTPEIGRMAVRHGHDLLLKGFTVSQVVHDYGDVCQSLTELAVEVNAPISTDDFRMLNQYLDEAIAGAVTEYGREQNQSTRDGETARGTERVGFLAHEIRNLTNTAIFAFEMLKTGNVGVAGSTGAVLHRSLLGLRGLVGRALAEAQLQGRAGKREPFPVSELIDEVSASARLDADARGLTFTVAPVGPELMIEADREILAAVTGNVLQNAFKFTRPRTTVELRVGASAERVHIEIQDECGGFPSRNLNELFRPFEQRGADRTGVGLGLAFSREAVEANNGRIYASNLPGRGCIFTIDLPRYPVRAIAGL